MSARALAPVRVISFAILLLGGLWYRYITINRQDNTQLQQVQHNVSVLEKPLVLHQVFGQQASPAIYVKVKPGRFGDSLGTEHVEMLLHTNVLYQPQQRGPIPIIFGVLRFNPLNLLSIQLDVGVFTAWHCQHKNPGRQNSRPFWGF